MSVLAGMLELEEDGETVVWPSGLNARVTRCLLASAAE